MSDQAQELRKLRERLSSVLYSQSNRQPFKNKLSISFAGGKGGTGKTVLSVNVALSFAKNGIKTVLLDADVGLANANIILGIKPKKNWADFLYNNAPFEDILYFYNSNFILIPGASGISDAANLPSYKQEELLVSLDILESQTDILIIDVGAGIQDNIINFSIASNNIVVVTNPDPTALTDAYSFIKIISNRLSVHKIYLVINMARSFDEVKRIYEVFIPMVKSRLNVNLEILGSISYSEEMVLSVKQSKPLVINYPRSGASRQIEIISNKLLENLYSQNQVQSILPKSHFNKPDEFKASRKEGSKSGLDITKSDSFVSRFCKFFGIKK
ncbi:MAG TPA: MinD/ParA family protein [Thermodesulfobium narugense]|nr:MinD/ParA family protein [Thermodesulfobium narugense]